MNEVAIGSVFGQSRETVTVSELNRKVAGVLAGAFPLTRVHGEVANFTRAASGHWYLTLKDDAAQVRCVMFRGRNALVEFAPREGDAVEVLAQVMLYEARGEFQLNLESMRRAGQGRLFEEFLRVKDKLAAEGLFDTSVKRPLPAVPRAIGVVTSLQAAALRDVLSALARRAPYAAIVVYPVAVQGPEAGARIAQMLGTVGRRGEVDVVLLVRGGGSIEDLWAFNEEVVARAIRACRLPVVVGVGHESDYTIADFAADVRAPTPTAAAELAAPERASLRERIAAASVRLRNEVGRRLESAQQRADYAWRSLATPRSPLARLQARVADLQARLEFAALKRTHGRRATLGERARRLLAVRPATVAWRQRVAALAGALQSAQRVGLDRRRAQLDAVERALQHLDPKAVLARGYAIVFDAADTIVADASRLRRGDALRLVFARGAAAAHVDGIEQPHAERGERGEGAE
jgi:exodeoxyribonuclease VII large subunit